jgi:hypothetical protein
VKNGSWWFEVTALRQDSVNGVQYIRESPPSSCKGANSTTPLTTSNQDVKVLISNVPGAQGYNVYAAPVSPGAPCPGSNNAFGFVGTYWINVHDTTYGCEGQSGLWSSYCQSNQNVSGCPSLSTPQSNCTLGQWGFNISSTDLPSTWTVSNANTAWTGGAAMPDDPMGRWVTSANTPSLEPPRGDPAATPATGDLANANLCADPSSGALGHRSSCPGKVTPGGVIFYVSGGCYNIQSSGDSFIYSGPQFNWVAVYEPPATSCTNTLDALYNSGFEGMFYAPGATLALTSQWALETPAVGGIAVRALNISGASNLTVSYDSDYAPLVPAARVTG